MQILLANAKIMFDKADRKPISVPLFQSVANVLAEEMARMNVEELAGNWIAAARLQLKIGNAIIILWQLKRCLLSWLTMVRLINICVPVL